MFHTKTGAAALSVASTALLTSGKLAIGLYIGSVSVVAKGIHSSVDLLVLIRHSSDPERLRAHQA